MKTTKITQMGVKCVSVVLGVVLMMNRSVESMEAKILKRQLRKVFQDEIKEEAETAFNKMELTTVVFFSIGNADSLWQHAHLTTWKLEPVVEGKKVDDKQTTTYQLAKKMAGITTALCERALEYGGYLIKKKESDVWLLAFKSPESALKFSMEMIYKIRQIKLDEHEFEPKAGIHKKTKDANVIGDASVYLQPNWLNSKCDVLGGDINLAARITTCFKSTNKYYKEDDVIVATQNTLSDDIVEQNKLRDLITSFTYKNKDKKSSEADLKGVSEDIAVRAIKFEKDIFKRFASDGEIEDGEIHDAEKTTIVFFDIKNFTKETNASDQRLETFNDITDEMLAAMDLEYETNEPGLERQMSESDLRMSSGSSTSSSRSSSSPLFRRCETEKHFGDILKNIQKINLSRSETIKQKNKLDAINMFPKMTKEEYETSMENRTKALCAWVETNIKKLNKDTPTADCVEFVGDAGLLAFTDRKAAVVFCVELQKELRLNWEKYQFVIRIGIHQSEGHLYTSKLASRSCGDREIHYYGMAVHHAELLESHSIPGGINVCRNVAKDRYIDSLCHKKIEGDYKILPIPITLSLTKGDRRDNQLTESEDRLMELFDKQEETTKVQEKVRCVLEEISDIATNAFLTYVPVE